MKKHEHFKKRDKIRETTSQMNPDIFFISMKFNTKLERFFVEIVLTKKLIAFQMQFL